MTTFGDMLFQMGGVPVAALEVMLAGGRWYFCDPVLGDDAQNGETPAQAKKTIDGTAGGYSLLRDGYNDGLILIGKATAFNPSATITWAKNYAHLIGANAGLPGMGQRSRIVGTAALDLNPVMQVSGSGCVIANVQVYQGGDAATALGNLLISGDRNRLSRVFAAGGGHATPAADVGMYSLKITGAENSFEHGVIGLDTVRRDAANHELIVAGARNSFHHSKILCWSETAGKFLVQIDNSGGDLRDTEFNDVLFRCYTENWASGISNAFHMPAGGATHSVLLDALCRLAGVGMGWADVVTHVYGAGAAPNAGFGISLTPTT